jgi:hypothetical protein
MDLPSCVGLLLTQSRGHRKIGRVNIWLALLVIAGVVAVSIAAQIGVRSFAPRGGFFTDSDRAAGVFGVIGTSFAVLLAFVIFLAFESYGNAREKAGQEAVAVAELFQTAQLFAPLERRRLQGDLVCYARSVVKDEWRTMRDRRPSDLVQGWVARIENDGRNVTVSTPKQSAAYQHWFEASGGATRGSSRATGRGGSFRSAPALGRPDPRWSARPGLHVLLRRSRGAASRSGLDDRRSGSDRRLRTPHRALPRPAL